ncbi:MAG TPA: hypothetical protein VGO01_10085 [Bradyrhizobium sp.]|jgi:hypothetical protein|nr:hypothetical protein [Bradyrhizobium sp.]
MEMSAVTNSMENVRSFRPDRDSSPDRDRLVPATDRKCLDGNAQSVAQLDELDSSRSRGFGRYEI